MSLCNCIFFNFFDKDVLFCSLAYSNYQNAKTTLPEKNMFFAELELYILHLHMFS